MNTGTTPLPQLQALLVEPLSQVVDAWSEDLEVLAISEAWAAMFQGPAEKPTVRQQLGEDVFDDLVGWLKVFLADGKSPKVAKYQKLCGKDSDGLWFKALLTVSVPRKVDGLPVCVVPVVLSLVKKKMKRHVPRGRASLTCPTILEGDETDDSTASDWSSSTRSSSLSSSLGSRHSSKRSARDGGGSSRSKIDWTSATAIKEFQFLKVVPVAEDACAEKPGNSAGPPRAEASPEPRRKILISL